MIRIGARVKIRIGARVMIHIGARVKIRSRYEGPFSLSWDESQMERLSNAGLHSFRHPPQPSSTVRQAGSGLGARVNAGGVYDRRTGEAGRVRARG